MLFSFDSNSFPAFHYYSIVCMHGVYPFEHCADTQQRCERGVSHVLQLSLACKAGERRGGDGDVFTRVIDGSFRENEKVDLSFVAFSFQLVQALLLKSPKEYVLYFLLCKYTSILTQVSSHFGKKKKSLPQSEHLVDSLLLSPKKLMIPYCSLMKGSVSPLRYQ